MTGKEVMKDLAEAVLIVGFGLSSFVLFSQVPLPRILHMLDSVVLIIFIISFIAFLGAVYRKKLLIDGFAQQVSDEISRMDIDTPIAVTEKMLRTTAQFT